MRVLGTMRAVLSHHVDIINKCQMLLAVKGNGQRERAPPASSARVGVPLGLDLLGQRSTSRLSPR